MLSAARGACAGQQRQQRRQPKVDDDNSEIKKFNAEKRE